MKQYSGAVLFIDMLGIGALTRGLIRLTDADYLPWKVESSEERRHQFLGAKLLLQFRRSLVHIKKAWPSIKIAQLSDCAFLWSQDPVGLANASRELMWHVTRAGLLCRAGLAFGQIVEPDKTNLSLGQFILGDAVTSAVGLEGSGKGIRIFCDSEFASNVLSRCHFKYQPFAPIKNPLNGSIVDEFRWYTLPTPIEQRNYLAQTPLQASLALIELVTILRYSPRLNWNSCSREGKLQIACSIEAVSKLIEPLVKSSEYTFTVEHLMEQAENRSDVLRERIGMQFEEEISNLLAPQKKKKLGHRRQR